MVEVNGSLYLCLEIPSQTPSERVAVRPLQEAARAGLVPINNEPVHFLYFMYSLFVGRCRKGPRPFPFVFRQS